MNLPRDSYETGYIECVALDEGLMIWFEGRAECLPRIEDASSVG